MASAPSIAPNIHFIPADVSFVDALANGLWLLSGRDQLALSAMTVLLPNRRACRALQGAFQRFAGESAGGAMLLPRLQPIGDIDEDDVAVLGAAILGEAGEIAPAVPVLRRKLLLARMILASGRIGGARPRFDQALLLAESLCALLDEVETEGLSLDGLDRLVAGELARHWQVTLDFFDLLRRQWPAIMEEEGAIDPMARRNFLLDLQSRLWRAKPPDHPVFVAGSTGSIPATARLMATLAGLPKGAIILPGLDFTPDEEDWAAIEQDPSHPQFGMAQLLRQLGASRRAVSPWIGVVEGRATHSRQWLVSKAMLPAERTDSWPELRETGLGEAQAWAGIERIDCRNEQEEALVIALALREFLETEASGLAALATPDRNLAQRVAGELRRWSIEIDDSAGKPLSRCPEGAFFLTIASAAAQQWAPVPLLSMLKHPLCAGGRQPGALAGWAGELDRRVLRGPRPSPGWDGIEAALDALVKAGTLASPEFIRDGLNQLRAKTAALDDWILDQSPLSKLKSLTLAAEALAQSDATSGAERLYAGEAGEALALFIAEALESLVGLPACDGAAFDAMLLELMSRIDVRPRFGRNPRLFIWGPLEARLQQVDLMILGGMNEGTWPAQDGDDPWMSRPMRRQFGLPPLERRIGLAAHDFQQALGAKRVILTRAERVLGQPTVPSRWLLRLDALRACLNLSPLSSKSGFEGLAAMIDQHGEPRPCARPAPKPGRQYRPPMLSVTRIETWRRDPYAIYAAKILRLEKLDPLDQDPGLADLGTVIHHALHEYVSRYAAPPPSDPLRTILDIGRASFGEFMQRARVWAFWWPRFERIARWFLEQEAQRRPAIERSLTEAVASFRVIDKPLPFDLTARADRLDRLRAGGVVIIDYKTGAIPSGRDVHLGFAPQLALEAVLASRGAFPGIGEGSPVEELSYWRLSGGEKGGEVACPKLDQDQLDPARLAEDAEKGLHRLLEYYDRDDAAYPALPDARFEPTYNDYQHLERVLEWSSGEDGQ